MINIFLAGGKAFLTLLCAAMLLYSMNEIRSSHLASFTIHYGIKKIYFFPESIFQPLLFEVLQNTIVIQKGISFLCLYFLRCGTQ